MFLCNGIQEFDDIPASVTVTVQLVYSFSNICFSIIYFSNSIE